MRKRRRLGKVAAWLLAGFTAIYLVLRWFEHAQVYHPSRTLDASGAELGRPFDDVRFKAEDGIELNAWFFPANTNSTRAEKAVLVCHGNAGNISHRLDLCQCLLETGVNVFLLDYRGYGRSQGRPSEQGTYLDTAAAFQWLQRHGFQTTNVIAYGESLGGGPATELATHQPLAGLVLQSTFSSIPDVGARLFPWLPVRALSSIRYDTHSKLPGLRMPVLVMHSRDDDLIPFALAQRNFAAANEPKLFWELNGAHNEGISAREHFIAGIEAFLRMVEGNR